MLTHRKALTIATMVTGITLAGCSRSDDAAPPADNVATAATPAARVAPSPSPSPTAASPTPAAIANDVVPREAARSRDEQMQDDASATGMTARSTRDEQATEDTPAEPTENQ